MTLKGRHWVMLWLVLVLVTLGMVVMRQTAGYRTAARLREAREERAALEARRGELERSIRLASSRQVLAPRAEAALGLHQPGTTEFTFITLGPDDPGGLALPAPPARDTAAAPRARPASRATPRATTRRPAPRRASRPAARRH
ncbi:MAG TPA: hypothetical protein VFS07_03905 [Gemmatimonadales bacterium]|jgi:hypothetical protein|nr:hypothetical protein [Gemmatimonadales bacterium]